MAIPHTGKIFWKTACQWLVILAFTLGLGEVVARCYGEPGRLSWMLEKSEKIATFMGLPLLNETMEYDPFLFWRLKKNLNGFQVTGRVLDNYLDFSVTTYNHLRSSPLSAYNHLRSSPPSAGKQEKSVLVLGDSCTFGLGVNDRETWPAQLQMMLDQQGVEATVINAGVPGYSAFQGKRFLEKNGEDLDAELVIACFGFNDSDLWRGLSDIDVAGRMSAGQREPLIKNSRLYLFARYAVQNIIFTARRYSQEVDRPRLSEAEYRETVRDIKRFCDRHNMGLIYMIWPYRNQVSSRSDRLWFYQKYTADICRQERIECVNLISPFINAEQPLYIDHIHANPEGCRLVAQTVLPHVVHYLKSGE